MAHAECRPIPDAELRRWLDQERDRPPHAVDVALHVALLDARAAAGAEARVPAEWRAVAARRVRAGQPALGADQVVLDWAAVARLAERVCAIAATHDRGRASAFHTVGAWFAESGARAEELRRAVEGYLGGGRCIAVEPAEPPLARFVMGQAVRPFLHPYAAEVMALPESRSWRGLSCPVCGGEPDFSALAADGTGRHLLCGHCDAEWSDGHMGCPYCGNQDPESLGYFLAGAAYRLDACERCQRYIKTVDFRETWLRRPLALERILTPTMDLVARQEGYRAS